MNSLSKMAVKGALGSAKGSQSNSARRPVQSPAGSSARGPARNSAGSPGVVGGAAGSSDDDMDKMLPEFPCPKAANITMQTYISVGESSTATKNQMAPAGWEEEIEKDLQPYFKEIDNLHTALNVPSAEDSHYLNNEADVVRASAIYLLHGVNQFSESISVHRFPFQIADGISYFFRLVARVPTFSNYRCWVLQLRNTYRIFGCCIP